jgi:hypothetical protein
MTKSGILAAAAILASALASPAMAQEVISEPGYCAQFYPNANCQNKGPGNPYTGSYQRQAYRDQAYRDRTWQNSYNRYDDRRFWPGDVAAGVVGGDEYARRNGFVCTPGTWFRGEDGRRHLCQ